MKTIDGLPVLNAKHSVKITINKQDISKASVKEPELCAAARACFRELHAHEARVHLGRVFVRTNKGNWTRYITPKSLRSEIISFDRGGKFEPGEFVLSAPNPAKQSHKRQGSRTGQNIKGGKKRRSPTTVKNVRTGPA